MALDIITSDRVRTPAVPLSNAVRSGDFIFVSGTTPLTKIRTIAIGDFEAQMRQVMENLKALLEDAGSSLAKIVKANVILVRDSDFQAMNEIYRSYFEDGVYPARTTIVSALASKEFLLEIECVAEA
jgi:2-iminobutanoate/2-iminopropanoate deaminase